MRTTRLYVAIGALSQGEKIKIYDNDFHYLTKVLRKKNGDEINIFNGRDGEFLARITDVGKKSLIVECLKKLQDQQNQGFITLAFAPVKNVRIDFVAAKATEMGVAVFLPIITKYSAVDKINVERFHSNIKEAVEQCERNDIPQIGPIIKLEKLLSQYGNSDKIILLCDETHQGIKPSLLLPKISIKNKEIIILIGPEGGFAKEEFDKMRTLKNVYAISLGKRILRSDTAIIAALALVQEFVE